MADEIPIQLPASIPILTSTEITIDEDILGEGGFCTVSAVRRIKLLLHDDGGGDDHQSSSSTSHPHTGERGCEKVESRRKFAKQFDCYEQKYYLNQKIVIPGHTPPLDPMDMVLRPPRLALKRVKLSLRKEKYRVGVNDIMSEVSVLSKCSHPNIISLYAVGVNEDKGRGQDDASGDGDSDVDDVMPSSPSISFAIIDQLQSTLKNKLYKWREERGIGFIHSKKAVNRLWLERMVVIMNVTDAIQYLHSNGFVHRDIHPGNIGFAGDGVVKLFDFGLAKSVGGGALFTTATSSSDTCDDNELFNLTGCTGTMRYMAPEIALGCPYGFKADVYSLALVIYEILSLSKPYLRVVNPDIFHTSVFIDGLRPTIDQTWPLGIKDSLEKMWSTDSSNRLASKDFMRVVGDLLRGDDHELYPSGWTVRLATW